MASLFLETLLPRFLLDVIIAIIAKFLAIIAIFFEYSNLYRKSNNHDDQDNHYERVIIVVIVIITISGKRRDRERNTGKIWGEESHRRDSGVETEGRYRGERQRGRGQETYCRRKARGDETEVRDRTEKIEQSKEGRNLWGTHRGMTKVIHS